MPDQENTFVLKSVENDDRGNIRYTQEYNYFCVFVIDKNVNISVDYLSSVVHFFPRSVEYVVECNDSDGMAMWLLTIQANMRTHGISLSDLAERNRFVIIYFSSPIYIYIYIKGL